MSRKYHKLVVVPAKTSKAQMYYVQQRLLAIVNPRLAKHAGPAVPQTPASAPALRPRQGGSWQKRKQSSGSDSPAASSTSSSHLLPGYLIVNGLALFVPCNITDEFALRRLHETPSFQLAWYKNGRQLRQPLAAAAAASTPNRPLAALQMQQQPTSPAVWAGSRVQFLGANGRQLYISSATYADAGEYLCSWSKLPVNRQVSNTVCTCVYIYIYMHVV